MEQYSRRFIEELAKHINPTILEFFNKKKNEGEGALQDGK